MKRNLALAASTLIAALAVLNGVAVAGAQSVCTELRGTVQSGNICHVHAEASSYIIDLRWNTDYPDDQAVKDYIAQNRDRVVNAAQTPGARNLPYQMVVTYETFRSGQPTRTIPEHGQRWHGTQSLVLNTYQFVDAPAANRYKSFTFDYDKNRPVTFENLFAPGTNPIDAIYPAVAAEMARQQTHRHFQLSPSLGRNPALYQNFAITDDTVIFFLDQNVVLPLEAGYFFVPIPRDRLPPLQL